MRNRPLQGPIPSRDNIYRHIKHRMKIMVLLTTQRLNETDPVFSISITNYSHKSGFNIFVNDYTKSQIRHDIHNEMKKSVENKNKCLFDQYIHVFLIIMMFDNV